MITILEEPVKTVGGRLSNFVAARTQIRYKVSQYVTVPAAGQRVAVKVFKNPGAIQLTPIEFKFAADQNNELVIDMSQIVTDLLVENGLLSEQIYFTFEDFPNVDADPAVLSQIIVGTYAQRQVGASGGSNLWPYLFNNTPLGFFPTQFYEPKVWEGWKRDVYFYKDSNYTAGLRFIVDNLDINKQLISNRQDELLLPPDPGVHYASIDTETIDPEVKYLRVYFLNEFDEQQVDYKDYKVECEGENPIFVEWITSLGTKEQHLFKNNQTITNTVSAGAVFELGNDEDIANVDVVKARLDQSFTQRLTLTAEMLSENDVNALREIKESPIVRIMRTRTGDAGMQSVPVIDFTTRYDTEPDTHDFTCVLEMPDNFDVYKYLLYDALDLLAPSNLTAIEEVDNLGEVELNWVSNSANFESGFRIQRSTDPAFSFPAEFLVGTGVTTYIDAAVQPQTTYYYRVLADGTLESEWSNVASVTLYGVFEIVVTPTGNTFTYSQDPSIPFTGHIDWDDGSSDDYVGLVGDAVHNYADSSNRNIKIAGQDPCIYFNNGTEKSKLLGVLSWGDAILTQRNFFGCNNLQPITAADAPRIINSAIGFGFVFANTTNMTSVSGIDTWDFTGVTGMWGVFQNSGFNDDFGSLIGVGDIAQLRDVFLNNSVFNGAVNNAWKPDGPNGLLRCFFGATSFNKPVDNWDVSSTTLFNECFIGCAAFNQSLAAWDIRSGLQFNSFLSNCGMDQTNWDATLIAWDALAGGSWPNAPLDADGLSYTSGGAADTARTSLIAKGLLIQGDVGV